MMTKNTSKVKATIAKGALFILFTTLIVILCIQFYPSKESKSELLQDKRRDYIYSGIRIIVDDQNRNKKINDFYENLDINTKRRYLGAYSTPSISKKTPSVNEFENWKNDNFYIIWINNKKIIHNSSLNYLNRNEIAYFSNQKIDFKFNENNKGENIYYLYTNAFFEIKRLGRFPEKYCKKEIKLRCIKAPTKEKLKIMKDSLEKKIEENKIKSLNTSHKYTTETLHVRKRITKQIAQNN